MLVGSMLIWFVLTAFSVIFVVWDSLTNGASRGCYGGRGNFNRFHHERL